MLQRKSAACNASPKPKLFVNAKARQLSRLRRPHAERLMLMNKRDSILSLIDDTASPDYIPAAFFLHFDSAYHQGEAAIDKHLEFFRATGMDFVKIQYEQPFP